MQIDIRVFYSEKFRKNITYINDLIPFLRDHGFIANAYEVAQEADAWKRLGLKSVPSIVVVVDKTPVYNIVSYEPLESVLHRVQTCIACLTEHRPNSDDEDIGEHFFVPPERCLDYYIEASSGCHRYERWNEELLKSEAPVTGWCCPSYGDDHEFIIFGFQGRAMVDTLLLRPRSRSDGTDSHKSFPKSISLWIIEDDDTERMIWRQVDIHLRNVAEPFAIRLEAPHECRRLKLVIEDKHDIDGKSFPSIAGVRILGEALDMGQKGYFVKNSRFLQAFNPRLFFKNGLFAADNISVERYNLLQDQRLPNNVCSVHKLLIAIDGSVIVHVNETKQIALKVGDVAIIEPSYAFSVQGAAAENAVLVVFNNERLESVWESR